MASYPATTPGHGVSLDEIYTGSWVDCINDLNTRLAAFERTSGQVIQTSAQTLTTATDTAIAMDAETLDPLLWHSTSTNNSRVTPSIAGYYFVAGKVGFSNSGAGGVRIAFLRVNGSTNVDGSGGEPGSSTASVPTLVPTGLVAVHFNGSTDYVELMANQTTGANLNTVVSTFQRSVLTWQLIQRD